MVNSVDNDFYHASKTFITSSGRQKATNWNVHFNNGYYGSFYYFVVHFIDLNVFIVALFFFFAYKDVFYRKKGNVLIVAERRVDFTNYSDVIEERRDWYIVRRLGARI